MKKITEGTFLPISLIIVLAGIIWWAAALDSRVDAQEKDILEISSCGKQVQEELKKIAIDIAEIKTELKNDKKQ